MKFECEHCGIGISHSAKACRPCAQRHSRAGRDNAWRPEDDERLLAALAARVGYIALQRIHFPNRTLDAIKGRAQRLRDMDKVIQPQAPQSFDERARRASMMLHERQMATGQIASVDRMIEWHRRHNVPLAMAA